MSARSRPRNPPAQQAEHSHQGEVVQLVTGRRQAGEGLELAVGEPRVGDSAGTEGRRTCSAVSAQVPSRTRPGQPGRDREPATRRGLERRTSLHPPDVRLRCRPLQQRIRPCSRTGQVAAQVRPVCFARSP